MAAKARSAKLLSELNNTKLELKDAKLMYETATQQLGENTAEHNKAMAALQQRVGAAELKEAELTGAFVDKGGRPRGHAARAELEG
eukprot:1817210-Pleurochrysis_carterae.AAC.1